MSQDASTPGLQASRSSIVPSHSQSNPSFQANGFTPEHRSSEDAPDEASRARPSIVRSQSYISPTSTTPMISLTTPIESVLQDPPRASLDAARSSKLNERSHRIHLPGSSRRHQHRHSHDVNHIRNKLVEDVQNKDLSTKKPRKHRYTQSEAHQYKRSHKQDFDHDNASGSDAGGSSRRHRVKGHDLDKRMSFESTRDRDKHLYNPLSRITTSRSNRFIAQPYLIGDSSMPGAFDPNRLDPRFRAINDQRRPALHASNSTMNIVRLPNTQGLTSIERDLIRVDQEKQMKKLNASEADVARLDHSITEAESEIRDNLTHINTEGLEMTRRLDYSYYSLLEKLGNLRSTIHSFQSLSTQSEQLLTNFEHESDKLSANVRRKLTKINDSTTDREGRITKLDARAQVAALHAEDLGRRFETAQQIVSKWERRESKSRHTKGMIWTSLVWTIGTLLITFTFFIIYREWWFHNNPVRAGLGIPPGGSSNTSLQLGISSPCPPSSSSCQSSSRSFASSRPKTGDDLLAYLSESNSIPDEALQILKSIQTRNRDRQKLLPGLQEGTDRAIQEFGIEVQMALNEGDKARLRGERIKKLGRWLDEL